MSIHASFLASIEAYLSASGMSAFAFGSAAVKDPNFVRELRAGRSPSLRIVEKVEAYMQANPPPPEARAAS